MNDTTFNVDEFMNASCDAMSSVREGIAEGEYPAVVDKVEARKGTSQKNGKPWYALDVFWDVDAPEEAQRLGRTKITARQSMFLDIDPKTGRLSNAKGMNVDLGKLREAVGQNTPGKEWNPNMLQGAAAIVKISMRQADNGDQYNDVKGVRSV